LFNLTPWWAGDLISVLLKRPDYTDAGLHDEVVLNYQTMEDCAQMEFQQEVTMQLQLLEQLAGPG
jgi:hypothetical protein